MCVGEGGGGGRGFISRWMRGMSLEGVLGVVPSWISQYRVKYEDHHNDDDQYDDDDDDDEIH